MDTKEFEALKIWLPEDFSEIFPRTKSLEINQTSETL